jgi:hypothetical protein
MDCCLYLSNYFFRRGYPYYRSFSTEHVQLSWFNGNRTFELFMINHHERRKVHAKETLQLQF